jgi:uncharacterized protein DUF1326
MRRIVFSIAFCSLISINSALAQNAKSSTPEWSFNATIIEACSCPMFCQCYFNTKPAAHVGHEGHGAMSAHFCRANFAYRVNKGSYGDVKLDGVKFWLAGDLGGDFSQGETDWVEATFEPSATKEQRGALAVILSHVYPFKWKSFKVAAEDATVSWQATKDRAEARLNGGKNGELVLRRYPGMSDDPIVIRNLRYFGAPRNEGFILMPNEVEAYRVGDKPFEYKGTNGFMITIDITSKDIKK